MIDKNKKNILFSRRSLIVISTKALTFALLAYRFGDLQLLNGDRFRKMAQNNIFRNYPTASSRGEIIDARGIILASNQISYSLFIESDQSEIHTAVIEKLSAGQQSLSPTTPFTISSSSQSSREKSSNITKLSGLHWEQVARIYAVPRFSDRVTAVKNYRRHYPHGHTASHITGYVAQDKKSFSGDYKSETNFIFGKSGIEKIYDTELRGHDGIRKVEVDSLGKPLGRDMIQETVAGKTIVLSFDLQLQQIAAAALNGRAGCAVIIDPRTGQIKAMYSSRTYDPNLFSNPMSDREWQKITSDPEYPLVNRCISATYPPGSVFKLAVALAILEHRISPQKTIYCSGGYMVGKRYYHCWNSGGHGQVNLRKALTLSCNTYFYAMALEIEISKIKEACNILGLGHKTGIDLPFEAEGIIPTPAWKKRKIGSKWVIGDTANTAIGQGYTLTTPLQLALLAAQISSGKRLLPRLVQRDMPDSPLACCPENLSTIRNCLQEYRVSPSPHAHRTSFFGKTGTAQIISQKKSVSGKEEHSLFIGYTAPAASSSASRAGNAATTTLTDDEQPSYAISLVVENGGWGSQTAVPIARQIIDGILQL